jgi:hypothetical protein
MAPLPRSDQMVESGPVGPACAKTVRPGKMCRTPLRIAPNLGTFQRGTSLAIDPVQKHWMIGSPTESVGDMAAIGVIVVGRRGKARYGESGKEVHAGR